MKYQEKIRLAEEAVQSVYEGKNFEDLRSELKASNYYDYEIESVFRSAKKLVLENKGDQFRDYLMRDDLALARGVYSELNDEVFEEIKNFKIKEIVEDLKRETDALTQEEYTNEAIVESVSNQFYPEEEVLKQISFYKKHNMPLNRQEKQNYRAVGIVIMLAGIALSVVSYNYPKAGSFTIYFGVIILGIFIFFKSEIKN